MSNLEISRYNTKLVSLPWHGCTGGSFVYYTLNPKPYRRNQALERDWQQMLDEKFRLQMETKALSQHLNALLNDKFGCQTGKAFDADTPIDKALTFLQFIIAVCHMVLPCGTPGCITCLQLCCTCQQLLL